MTEEQPTPPVLMFWLAPEEQGYNLSNLPHYWLAEGQNLWGLRKRGGHGGHGLGEAELRRTTGRALREHVQCLCRLQRGNNGGEQEENFGEFPVTVGGRGPSDVRFSRTRTRVCARRWLYLNPSKALGSN